jgi:DNA integrity scanning protein DisA with diadenylate cyclase activity/mannitol/fructose-specific phosphotransferase system IIA component (Ntr-type)
MNFTQYLSYNSIVELSSTTFKEAITELLQACHFKGNADEVSSELIVRENDISSYIGRGMVVPNLRMRLPNPYEIFIGRTSEDIKCGPARAVELANVVVLILASEHERGYLSVISGLINFFQNPSIADQLQSANSFDAFKTTLIAMLKKTGKSNWKSKSGANEIFLRNAIEVARVSHCASVMLFGDVAMNSIDIDGIFDGIKLINVVQSASGVSPAVCDSHIELQVSMSPTTWAHGFRGGILFALTREIIAYDEKVCCVGCNSATGILDVLFIIDVEKEFRPIFTSNTKFLPCDIKPEVLERTLSVATDIATEGREGKAVGCLFVLGDINRISLFTKPLVMNPFYGYPEADRNILSQFMDETVKEFSLIDGAFVIRGDGIIESAGTLIYTPNHNIVMPSGFGSRHAAAASISWAAGCIAIAVSESTRTVTLFQNGQMLQVVQK